MEKKQRLLEILHAVVPEKIPRAAGIGGMQTKDEFAGDVCSGIRLSTMSVRLMLVV